MADTPPTLGYASATPTGKADQLLQQRGVTMGVVGLVMQVVLAITSFVLWTASGRSYAGQAMFFAALGLLPWGAVAIAAVLRRARTVEAFEIDAAVRAGDAGRTIFESEAEARPAARRLSRFYRFAIPAVSGLLGVLLVFFGLLGLQSYLAIASVPPANASLIAGIAAAMAFFGFIVGYYLMGMSRSLRWPVLRGGATYLLGTVLLLALLAVAGGATTLGFEQAVSVVAALIPAVMALVGVELLLNVVVDLYRPKAAAASAAASEDETVRAAFDSRLLQLLVSPGGVVRSLNEAVNYQFGFEITKSWFWRLLSRSIAWLIVFGIGVIFLMSSFVRVEPHEQAILTDFGRLRGEPAGPGLHLKWPWPISTARTEDVMRVRELVVGTHLASGDGQHQEEVFLWEGQHDGLENRLLLVASRGGDAGGVGNVGDTGDTGGPAADPETAAAAGQQPPPVALAAADLTVNYRVSRDAFLQYVTGHERPAERLRQMAEALLARELVKFDIDAAIGAERARIAREIESGLKEQVDREGLGVEIVWVGLKGVMPPKAVAPQFNERVAAEQDQRRLAEEGRQQAAQLLAGAAGNANRARVLAASIEDLQAAERAARSSGDDAAAEEVARLATLVEQQLQQAGGGAAGLLFDARRERWTRENDARSRAGRVEAFAPAFAAAPEYFKRRELLRVLTNTMIGRPKFLFFTEADTYQNIDLSSGLDIAGSSTLRIGPDEQ